MGAEAKILLWWLLFGGTHILGSALPVRRPLIRALGLQGFKGVYSLVSLATFIPLVWVYFKSQSAGEALFVPIPGAIWVSQVLMFIALVVLVQGYTTPSPIGTQAEMTGEYSSDVLGIQRVTRHPAGWGYALFGMAHCLVLPWTGDLLFFGGWIVFSLASTLHQDARSRKEGPAELQRFQDQTSWLPFGAILSGRQKLALGELNRVPLIVSVVTFVVLRLFHGRIFGGFGM